MFIKNRDVLLDKNSPEESLKIRKLLLNTLEVALESVKPSVLMKKAVRIEGNYLKIKAVALDLNRFERCIIIGGGKATANMALELEKLLISHGKITFNGIINVPLGLEIDKSQFSGNIELNFASHPIPNENGLYGTKKMMELVRSASDKDLIICLISGGGSALLPLPREGITLHDLKEVNDLLLASGASIEEINAVRKHLSGLKGGQLSMAANQEANPTILSLIISDVVGDRLDTIASGPTVPDQTRFQDAINVLKKYDLFDKIPINAKQLLEAGIEDKTPETPKKGDKCFNKTYNFVVGSVNFAVERAKQYLTENNAKVIILPKKIQGEARTFGQKLLNKIENYYHKYKNVEQDLIAVIASGELTVTIVGEGFGGRNQEMLLGFLKDIDNEVLYFPFGLISANLDGIDGNSEAMGALIDNWTLSKVKKQNINLNEFLENNDSNSFFKEVGDEVITGYTGINVNDLIICIMLRG